MSFSNIIKLVIKVIKILLILSLKPMNGLKQLYLIFPLYNKNPILKSLNMSFEPILY